MDYYLNEYSLRGQFKSIEDFFESLRVYTFPILKIIQEHKENIIWKKDTFWQSEICKGVFLTQIPIKKNERSAELTLLQMKLIKLATENPFWESNKETDLEIKEYKFDEAYRENFEKVNCFTNAIENEGRVISFIHSAYSKEQLPVIIKYDDAIKRVDIDNIYTSSWWKNEPEIKTWKVFDKYLIQVRAKEFEYHPPHFHAIFNEYAAVFKLSNGELYRDGKKKWSTQMIAEVQEWYQVHREELQTAWKNLHKN